MDVSFHKNESFFVTPRFQGGSNLEEAKNESFLSLPFLSLLDAQGIHDMIEEAHDEEVHDEVDEQHQKSERFFENKYLRREKQNTPHLQ